MVDLYSTIESHNINKYISFVLPLFHIIMTERYYSQSLYPPVEISSSNASSASPYSASTLALLLAN
jgi:hypothetical protein